MGPGLAPPLPLMLLLPAPAPDVARAPSDDTEPNEADVWSAWDDEGEGRGPREAGRSDPEPGPGWAPLEEVGASPATGT